MYLPISKQQNALTAQSRPISAMTDKDRFRRSPKKFLDSRQLSDNITAFRRQLSGSSPTVSRHSADSSPAALRQYHGIPLTALRQLADNLKTIGQGRRKRNAALSGGVALCCFLFLFFCAYAFFNQGCRFGGLACCCKNRFLIVFENL